MLDDREKAFRETLALLDPHPDLSAIYNVGGGTAGIARALKDRGLAGKLVLIAHDATDSNKALVLEGTLDAIIDQNARVESRESLAALIHAVRKTPYTVIPPQLQIIFRANLPDEQAVE